MEQFRGISDKCPFEAESPFSGRFTELQNSFLSEDSVSELYEMYHISLDYNHLPLLLQPPIGPYLDFPIASLVSQRLALRITNHGESSNDACEEWAVILSEEKTIVDKTLISVFSCFASVTLNLSLENDIPFALRIFILLIEVVAIDAFIGITIRSISHKKLPLAITILLPLLTYVVFAKAGETSQIRSVGSMFSRMVGSSLLLWIY